MFEINYILPYNLCQDNRRDLTHISPFVHIAGPYTFTVYIQHYAGQILHYVLEIFKCRRVSIPDHVVRNLTIWFYGLFYNFIMNINFKK